MELVLGLIIFVHASLNKNIKEDWAEYIDDREYDIIEYNDEIEIRKFIVENYLDMETTYFIVNKFELTRMQETCSPFNHHAIIRDNNLDIIYGDVDGYILSHMVEYKDHELCEI